MADDITEDSPLGEMQLPDAGNQSDPAGSGDPPTKVLSPLQQQAAQLATERPDLFGNRPDPQPKPAKPAGFGRALADFAAKAKARFAASTLGKADTAIARGLADAVDNTSNAVVGTGAFLLDKSGLGHAIDGADWDAWYRHDTAEVNPLQIGEQRKDALFGRKQGGVYDFVENATAFTAAMAAGGEAGSISDAAPAAVRFLRSVGLQGLAASVTTDSRAARLSDMIEHGPPGLSNPLTRWLKSNGQDSEALARLKAGLEGAMTGAAIDGFIGSAKSLLSSIRGASSAANGALDAVTEAAPKPTPEPVKVVPLENGGYGLEHTTPAEVAEPPSAAPSKLPAGLAEIPNGGTPATGADSQPNGKPALPALLFDSAADAESHAASLNEAINTQSIPVGHVDDADVAALQQAITALPSNAFKTATIEDVLPRGLFNYNYFGGPQASQAVIETLAQRFLEPVVGLKNRAADGLGVSGSELMTKAMSLVSKSDADSWLGQAKSDADALPEIQARQLARKIVVKSLAGKVADLSRALDVNPTNAVAASNMKAATEQLLYLAAETSGVDSGAGRLLQSLKNVVPNIRAKLGEAGEADAETFPPTPGATNGGSTSEAEPENVLSPPPGAGSAKAEELPTRQQSGDRSALDILTPDDWRQMARQVRLSEGNPALILDSILGKAGQRAAEADPSKWEVFNAYRVNSMLSGPKTLLVNAVSNAMSSLQAPLEYFFGGAITGKSAVRQQGSDMLAAMWTNLGAAWSAAARSWRLGESILDSRGGMAQDGAISDAVSAVNKGGWLSWLGKFQVPSRVLMSTDEFFKNFNYLNSVRALSLRAAREDMTQMGTMSAEESGEYMAQRLASDLASSVDANGHALNPVALSYARDATFQTPLTGAAKWIQDGVQQFPALRLVLPFVRTPVNLMRYAWERTPILGALTGDMADDLAAGGDRAARAIGKQTLGAAVWGSAATYALMGNMTGAGPTDPKLRKQWLDAGHQPYSLRIPGTSEWVSYRRLDQLGTPLGLVADIVAMSGELHPEDTANAASKFMAAIAANLTSKTFLSSLADTFDAMHSGDPNKWSRLLNNEAGSLIPAALRQVDGDDEFGEVRGFVDAMKSRVPGLSETLEPRRNILGEPVMKAPGYLNYALNPFTLSPGGRVDPVQDQLVQLGRGMSMPRTTVNGVDLTDRDRWKPTSGKHQSPYDRLLELIGDPQSGPSLRQNLTELISSDGWKTYSDERRQLMVQTAIQTAQIVAMQQVKAEYPALAKALLDTTVGRADKVGASRSDTARTAPQFLQP